MKIWRVHRRNEQGKIIDVCRVAATSRKEAKKQAAQQWNESIENLTAIQDKERYPIDPSAN